MQTTHLITDKNDRSIKLRYIKRPNSYRQFYRANLMRGKVKIQFWLVSVCQTKLPFCSFFPLLFDLKFRLYIICFMLSLHQHFTYDPTNKLKDYSTDYSTDSYRQFYRANLLRGKVKIQFWLVSVCQTKLPFCSFFPLLFDHPTHIIMVCNLINRPFSKWSKNWKMEILQLLKFCYDKLISIVLVNKYWKFELICSSRTKVTELSFSVKTLIILALPYSASFS